MMLSDQHIRRLFRRGLTIEPHDLEHLGPASYDVCLSDKFLIPRDGGYETVEGLTQYDVFHLRPHQLVLACTKEFFRIPDDIAARVEGKSTWGRRGLLVHLTAGFIDPGFQGQVTLELLNVSAQTMQLTPGIRIAQVSFHQLSGPAARPYGSPKLNSHYQGQLGPTPPHTGK